MLRPPLSRSPSLLVVFALLLALPGAPWARRRTGRVLVQSMTAGATIEIDGQLIGEVPMRLPFVVKAGRHTVRVTKPGHAPFEGAVAVRAGRDAVVEADLMAMFGVLRVQSDPPGATVLLDGRAVGVSPFEGDVEPGQRVLTVTARGFAPHRSEVALVRGEVSAHRVVLVPAPALAEQPVGGDPWYGRWWVWAAAGAVVAGTVTAAIVLSADGEGAGAPTRSLTFEPVR